MSIIYLLSKGEIIEFFSSGSSFSRTSPNSAPSLLIVCCSQYHRALILHYRYLRTGMGGSIFSLPVLDEKLKTTQYFVFVCEKRNLPKTFIFNKFNTIKNLFLKKKPSNMHVDLHCPVWQPLAKLSCVHSSVKCTSDSKRR